MAKKAPAKKAPAKRKPRAKRPVVVEPLTDGLQIIKPVPEEIISFNAGQVLTGGYLRKRLNLNGQIETYSLAPIETGPIKSEKKAAKPPLPPMSEFYDALDGKIVVPSKSIAWRSWLVGGAKAAALIVVGAVAGVYAAGGIPIGPGPQKPDVISAVFDEQESALRELSGERAKALRAGSIKSEAESVSWMQSRFLPRVEAAWTKLLTTEAAEFGGEKWTAEKEAAWIERYVR